MNMVYKNIIFRMAYAFFPRGLRRRLHDSIQIVNRAFPGKHLGIAKYDLSPTQVYPNGTNFFSTLRIATTKKFANFELHPTTPVASIGSCFAEKFAYFMKEKNYNYVSTEKDVLSASANWGRVYTIPNLLQVVRYSIEESYPMILSQCKQGWFDPLRELRDAYFVSRDDAEKAVRAHRQASYKAFTSCNVLIITLGQNEAWVENNQYVWARIPPEDVFATRREEFSFNEFSFEENVQALKSVINLLFSVNSTLKICFTISPVSSHATFVSDDIITQSFANKCLLRAVLQDVIAENRDQLFYFPSFEMVMCDNPHNFCADNRHVKWSTINRIFNLFTACSL